MWRCSFLCPVRLTIAISSVIAALWLLGGKTGAGVRGILSRESSVTRPANPGEASMDYVHCICLAGVTKLDGNQWSIVLKYWKLLASWKEAPTLQGLTCRTELGCRWSGVISIPSSPPPLSLSLFVFFIQFNTERSLDGERISSFRSLSLSLSLWLINRDGMSVGHKSTLTRKVTITITADRLTYIQNAFMPEIWYMELSYASAYHNSIAKQILSWSRLLVLRPLLCYVFATIASRTRRFECSPETGTCKREVLWLC